jgi:hypothetical protein
MQKIKLIDLEKNFRSMYYVRNFSGKMWIKWPDRNNSIGLGATGWCIMAYFTGCGEIFWPKNFVWANGTGPRKEDYKDCMVNFVRTNGLISVVHATFSTDLNLDRMNKEKQEFLTMEIKYD